MEESTNTANYEYIKDYVLKGEKLEIMTYPAPCLKIVAKPVENFDNDLKNLCKNMLFTMYKAPGLGLAAPQVSISKQIFVIDIDYEREKITHADESVEMVYSNFKPQIFINPIIKNKSGEIIHEEGCLSLPGVFEEVKRFQTITVVYQDVDGNEHTFEAIDLQSVCIQHENDHLLGKIFLDRLSILKRNLLKKKFLKEKKKPS